VRLLRLVTTVAVALAVVGGARTALAQQATFKLDRLEMPGAPDDGVVLFRPVTQDKPIFFAQLGLGLSINPLRTRNVTEDASTIRRSSRGVIDHQFTQYTTVGFQLLDRITLAATLPVTWSQDGQNPQYSPGNVISGVPGTTAVNTSGPALNDTRLDLRAVLARSQDRRGAFGAQLSLFAPTGSNANFGGDGQTTLMPMVQGEYAFRWFTLTGNLGVHLRPRHSINSPAAGSGLGIGNEVRWAVGAFVPIKEGKFRVGGTIFGQTGIENDNIVGDTFFTRQNTPIEWNVEGRMKFGKVSFLDDMWIGAGGGSFINPGYGAPDLRVVALIGAYLPLVDTNPNSPDRRAQLRAKWRAQRMRDTDNDGIPDDIDACPTEAEDHKGSDPNDGCPALPDRDGDGIPDQYDRCPDTPEDFDGIDDGDGCPEDDFDQDGVPDTVDHCPKEPGKPSPDPNKHGCPQFISMDGTVIRINQQVHFKTGSAQILPDSFPMLQEIAELLKANPAIKRMSVEGHTDNRGGADLNRRLSQARSESVMKWLVQRGVEEGRLEAHGYGPDRPIADNETDTGRAANRRVEFKIVDQVDTNRPAGQQGR
jgi:outer membrane protein OmpA-like peptidoglycan-associated protein